MSDKPISVGDLVMVVRTETCGCEGGIGRTFIVKSLNPDDSWCSYCQKYLGYQTDAFDGQDWHSLYVLKRIDPPALPESVQTKEGITA